MTEPAITHESLRKKAMQVLKRDRYNVNRRTERVGFGCSIVLSELYSAANDVPDAIGWVYGHSVLIECKISRSDFLADQKKPQRLAGTGSGEQRYYFAPRGLLSSPDLPPDWGLLELDGQTVLRTVAAPRRQIDISGHQQEKKMLLSTISRIRCREFLIISRPENVEDMQIPADDEEE